MDYEKIALNQLDEQLNAWEGARHYMPPPSGWIKLIRSTLGLPAAKLAAKMNLSRARVAQMESAEINDTITLQTLRRAAEAMGCRLVYGIIPDDSLKSILEKQARQLAEKRVARVSHTMGLEAQALEKKQQQQQVESLTQILLAGPLKKIWEDE